MAFKEFRKLKVCEQSGYKYKATPSIQLKGQWLKEVGFDLETPVIVQCASGRLTITIDEAAQIAYQSEVDEKAMRVAEAKAGYGRKKVKR